jgi:DNA-binding beta-propeller fold protein YncE
MGDTPTNVTLLKDGTTITGIAGIYNTSHVRSIDMTTPGSPQLLASPDVLAANPPNMGYLRPLPGPRQGVVMPIVDGDQLAVIDYSAAGTVTPVDLNALAGPSACTAPCQFPVAIAVDAVAGKVVVVNYGTATLQVLNVTSTTSGWTFTAAGDPIALPVVAPVAVALDTSSGVAVVADSPDPSPGGLVRVGYKSPATYGAVSATIQIGNTPSQVAVNPTTHEAVVALSGDNTIQIVNLTTGAIRSTIPAGVNPSGVVVDPGSNRALVANINNNEITAINLTPATPSITRFQLSTAAAQNPTDIVWDPASGQVLAATLIGQVNYAIVIGGLTPTQVP